MFEGVEACHHGAFWRAAIRRLLLCAFVGAASFSCAQAPVEGTLRGVAIDSAARVIAHAQVQAIESTRGLRFAAICDARGGFALRHLPPGSYDLSLTTAAGTAAGTPQHVTVEAGGTTEVALTLRPVGTSESVVVTAEPASLDQPAASALTSVVGQEELDRLPLDGRRWQSFAVLTPAVNGGDGDLGASLLTARGLAVTQNSTSLDGVDDDNSFHSVPRGQQNAGDDTDEDPAQSEPNSERGGAVHGAGSWRRSGAAYGFSQSAVREFRISTQNYSALYGHGAGAVIATVSRSGSNQLHGSGFYYGRSSAFAATNPFSLATRYRDGAVTSSYVRPPDMRHQFGGTLGGPVLHDHLFFFYAFDQQRRGYDAVSSPADPAFYALTAMQRTLLLNRGVRASQINAALNYIDSLTGTVPRRDDQTLHFVKLDAQPSAAHHLSAQYNRLRSARPAGLLGAPVVSRGVASLGSGYTRTDTLLARWSWAATRHFHNELRFAWGRDLQYEQPQTPLPQEPAIGINGLAPQVTIAPYGFSFGTPSGLGRVAYPDERRTQFTDTASWGLGRHLVQAGIAVGLLDDNVSALNNTVGSFRYDSGTTNGRAGGLVDWITDYTFNVNAYPNGGCPSITASVHLFCFRSYTQSFGEQTVQWRTQEWAGFVEDSWRPAANLSLHLGARYEYLLLPLPQRVNPALDAIFGARGATGIFPEDRNNIGPRVGLAWSPFGESRGVVRAGYGVYYGRVPGATVRSALANTALATSALNISITPSTVTACPQVANQGFGYPCAYTATPPSAVAVTSSAVVFSRRFRTPMVQQGTLSVERELGRSTVASATYLMNLDRQLESSVDLNIAPATTSAIFQLIGGAATPGVRSGDRFVLPVYTSRLASGFGPVTAITSNVNASYHALALELERRARGGLGYRVAWTWSKAIDQGQATGGTLRTNAQLDPFDSGYDKGLSRLNDPHKLVASAIWQPRLRTADAMLRRLANGWGISGIFYETAGRPYSYEISGGDRLSGGHTSINGAGGAVYLPTVGRNTLRLPDTARLDLRLARSLQVHDRLRAMISAEAFNLFNRTNYTGVEQRAFLVGDTTAGVTALVFQDAAAIAAAGLNTRPFETYTEAGSASSRERQLQLALRLEF